MLYYYHSWQMSWEFFVYRILNNMKKIIALLTIICFIPSSFCGAYISPDALAVKAAKEQGKKDQRHMTYQEVDGVLSELDQYDVVLMGGLPISGKSVTADRWIERIEAQGRTVVVFRFDAYFRDYVPGDDTFPIRKGNVDWSDSRAIDMEEARENLRKLLEGETIEVPKYDFSIQRRTGIEGTLTLLEGALLIIDSAHALDSLQIEVIRQYHDKVLAMFFTGNDLIRWGRRLVRDKARGRSPYKVIRKMMSELDGGEATVKTLKPNADIIVDMDNFDVEVEEDGEKRIVSLIDIIPDRLREAREEAAGESDTEAIEAIDKFLADWETFLGTTHPEPTGDVPAP